MATFLTIPLELRFAIYEAFLSNHQRVFECNQPSNQHIRVLRACRQINAEAAPIFRRYVSLLHERQIHAFLASDYHSWRAQVIWADVANDGRFVHNSSNPHDGRLPLSQLHLALAGLPSLKYLRVFECRQGHPISLHWLKSTRFTIQFEDAMFPSGNLHKLLSYELFLSAGARVHVFSQVPAGSLEILRLSGDCLLPPEPPNTPALRHLTLNGVTGNYFDRHTLDQCFHDANLETFCYSLVVRTGFEIRDRHLETLVAGPGRNLRKLVLLNSNRLTSSSIADALSRLQRLEYFALSLTTVEELRTDFLVKLPVTLKVLKFSIMNAWYAAPLIAEEQMLCDTIERVFLFMQPPLHLIAVHFRARLMEEDGRGARWEEIARQQGVKLCIGPWESEELKDF